MDNENKTLDEPKKVKRTVKSRKVSSKLKPNTTWSKNGFRKKPVVWSQLGTKKVIVKGKRLVNQSKLIHAKIITGKI